MKKFNYRKGPKPIFYSVFVLSIASFFLCPAFSEEKSLPLKPIRVAEFTVDEGTWMSVDVSPDGKAIVFDLLGDIYSLPIEGGKAKPIVTGMDYAVQPRFSPDGAQIVFVSDRSGAMNLWISDSDGQNPRQFTHEPAGKRMFFSCPDWAPDGDSVIAWISRRRNFLMRSLPRQVRRYPLAKSEAEFEVLAGGKTDPKMWVGFPSLSPDQGFLYFSSSVPPGIFKSEPVFPLSQLFRKNLETGETLPLTDHHGGGFAPTLSPDGRYIVYCSRHISDTGLRLLDLKSGQDRWLLFPINRDQQVSTIFYEMPNMAFHPGTNELVLSFDGKIWRLNIQTGQAQQVPFTAEVKKELGPLVHPSFRVEDKLVTARQIRHPKLSPDGRHIVFTAMKRLWIVRSDGSELRRLVERESQQYHPAWSPDGRHVVFGDWSDSEGGHLYRVDAAGKSKAERITNRPANYFAPVYSPDGKSVHAVRIGGGHPDNPKPPYDHVALPSAGGEIRRMASLSGPAWPHFRQGSDRVFFSTRGSLLSIGSDGALKEHMKAYRFSHFYAEDLKKHSPSDFARRSNMTAVDRVFLNPTGSYALAEAGTQVFIIEKSSESEEVDDFGMVAIIDPGMPPGPVKKLTDVGGEFISWSPDGKSVLYALGATIFKHDRMPDGKISPTPTKSIDIDISYPVVNPVGVFAVTNTKIVTMEGDEIIEDGIVVVDGNRIVAVGPAGQVDIPAGAKVFDGSGKTLIPGFIDTHRHEESGWQQGARPQQPWQSLNYLAYGITTIHNPAQPVGELVDGDLTAAGKMIGPRIFGTGPAMYWESFSVDSYEEARNLVKKFAEYYKVNTIKQYIIGNRLQAQWVAMAAREFGVMTFIEGSDTNLNLAHVIDGNGSLAHPIGVCPLYDDALELIKHAGTSIGFQFGTLRGEASPSARFYFMNLTDPLMDEKVVRFMPTERLHRRILRRWEFHPKEHAFPMNARQAGSLMNRGVTVSLGDHGEWLGIGYHWEIWSASTGMSRHDALRMATIMGARDIGLDQDLGSIKKGKLADFLVFDDDPLQSIQNTLSLRYVVKNGEIFEPDSLTQIWPEKQVLNFKRWWDEQIPEMRPGATLHGGAPEYEKFKKEK